MNNYTFKDFLPLIIIFSVVIALTIIAQSWRGDFSWMSTMNDFMGFFFIVFGSFKVINLPGFVEAYQTYDIVAKQSILYAYLYPFIELGLGLAYLYRLYPIATNVITLIVMLVSSIGVFQKLLEREQIVCACLGAVFKIPMTWVTLTEDLLMAGMAFAMLLMR
ncbi:MAG: MauE/DoxX family redox-associated membrane protein [Candidatus Babeliales bacterium]